MLQLKDLLQKRRHTMRRLQSDIQAYQPTCLQEQQDQKQLLHLLELFSDLLSRENPLAHFTSSAFIVNPQRTKTLFIHHKIYQTWCWTGGHADGQTDLTAVALKEAREETGITNFKLLSTDIASLDILPVIGHLKNGRWVSAHLHLNLAYVLEAQEDEPLIQNKIETNGLKWLPFDDIPAYSNEPNLLPVYQKLIDFTKQLKESL